MSHMDVVGHGVDLVENPRIARLLAEHGSRFIDRCFTAGERDYAEAARRLRVQRYAVRFACKEAVLKALGTGLRNGISWRDIEICRRPSGQPLVVLRGRCAELADEMSIREWHVSLSHTAQSALASVIGCG